MGFIRFITLFWRRSSWTGFLVCPIIILSILRRLLANITVDDSYFKSFDHHIWILAVSYTICKIYGGLTFSDVNKKYFHLDKITGITKEVLFEIRSRIAKQSLIWCGVCITLGVCVYKCLTSCV
jgi:hypothetical protein